MGKEQSAGATHSAPRDAFRGIPATELLIPPRADAPVARRPTEASRPSEARRPTEGRRRVGVRQVGWMLAAVVVGAAVYVIVTSGHQGGAGASDASGRGAGTTTVPRTTTSTTSTTTTPPTTTTPALPGAPQPTPEAAASALVSSWASGNAAGAATVATAPAVNALFSAPYRSGGAIDRGCSTATPPVCTFGPPGGGDPSLPIYSMTLVQAPSGGWYVSAVKVG